MSATHGPLRTSYTEVRTVAAVYSSKYIYIGSSIVAKVVMTVKIIGHNNENI